MIPLSRTLPARPARFRRLLAALAAWIALSRQRARGRRMLGALDDRLLRDIGIDRATARRESNEPFWR